jgi:hypothetical protein
MQHRGDDFCDHLFLLSWISNSAQELGGGGRRGWTMPMKSAKIRLPLSKMQTTFVPSDMNTGREQCTIWGGSRNIDGYGLVRSKGRSSSSGWGKSLSLINVVQTGPGAHPVSYPMCNWYTQKLLKQKTVEMLPPFLYDFEGTSLSETVCQDRMKACNHVKKMQATCAQMGYWRNQLTT